MMKENRIELKRGQYKRNLRQLRTNALVTNFADFVLSTRPPLTLCHSYVVPRQIRVTQIFLREENAEEREHRQGYY